MIREPAEKNKIKVINRLRRDHSCGYNDAMNLHGSTIASAVPFFGVLSFTGTSNVMVLSAFLAVAVFSFILAVGTVVRFFINFRKYGALLAVPERKH